MLEAVTSYVECHCDEHRTSVTNILTHIILVLILLCTLQHVTEKRRQTVHLLQQLNQIPAAPSVSGGEPAGRPTTSAVTEWSIPYEVATPGQMRTCTVSELQAPPHHCGKRTYENGKLVSPACLSLLQSAVQPPSLP